MKRVILTFMLLGAACAGARAQAPAGGNDSAEARRRDIRRLLELTRGAELGAQIVRQSIDQVKQNMLFLPEAQREKVIRVFEEEMLREFSQEKMVEASIPIYEKHLTGEEIRALIDFYQTPLGRRMLAVLPAITREAYDDGARRGREAGMRAMARIADEGILASPGAAPPPPPPKRRAPRRRGN